MGFPGLMSSPLFVALISLRHLKFSIVHFPPFHTALICIVRYTAMFCTLTTVLHTAHCTLLWILYTVRCTAHYTLYHKPYTALNTVMHTVI